MSDAATRARAGFEDIAADVDAFRATVLAELRADGMTDEQIEALSTSRSARRVNRRGAYAR